MEDLEGEIWKDVVGYEGLYKVSNMGRVRSVDRVISRRNNTLLPLSGKVLIPGVDKGGYLMVNLSKNNKAKSITIHRLVAISFLPNIYGVKDVNHINHNKKDNKFDNLEWVNRRENCTHREFKKPKTSKFVGVCKPKGRRKWNSTIRVNKKIIRIGAFNTEIEAHKARVDFQIKNNIQNKYM